jgi:hypothetical protein
MHMTGFRLQGIGGKTALLSGRWPPKVGEGGWCDAFHRESVMHGTIRKFPILKFAEKITETSLTRIYMGSKSNTAKGRA